MMTNEIRAQRMKEEIERISYRFNALKHKNNQAKRLELAMEALENYSSLCKILEYRIKELTPYGQNRDFFSCFPDHHLNK